MFPLNHRLLVILNFDVDVNPLIPDTVSSCDSGKGEGELWQHEISQHQ